jgi:endoglucanase
MKRRSRPTSDARSARRWRPVAGGAAALLLAGLLAWLIWPRDPYALPGGDWWLFKKKFLSADGRVIDDGNGGITHSEGQGYGMLLAVAFRDRDAFDRMWTWTRTHLKRPDDFLFSWKWTPENGGRVGDVNNATDGDLLLAWALLRGFHEWNNYKYKQAAGQIVITILEKATAETYLGLQLLPGVVGFQKPEGAVLNPSYCVFPALTELATAFPSDKWKPLHSGAIALLETARFGKWKLTPDWTLVAPSWVALAPDHDPIFGYNAIRVPLHIAWDDPSSPLLAPFAKFWQSPSTAKWDPATVNLRFDSFGPYAALPGMLAVRELTLACIKKNKLTVADIPRLHTEESYYSASLKLLTKLAIRERFAPKRN